MDPNKVLNTTCTVKYTIEQVYGKPIEEMEVEGLTKGEALEFRVPKMEDVYLAPDTTRCYQHPVKGKLQIPKLVLVNMIERIYGHYPVKCPDGYEFVEFRAPMPGEDYLTVEGYVRTKPTVWFTTPDYRANPTSHRWIVRKLPVPKYSYVGFKRIEDLPKFGEEYYICSNERMTKILRSPDYSGIYYNIFKLEE